MPQVILKIKDDIPGYVVCAKSLNTNQLKKQMDSNYQITDLKIYILHLQITIKNLSLIFGPLP